MVYFTGIQREKHVHLDAGSNAEYNRGFLADGVRLLHRLRGDAQQPQGGRFGKALREQFALISGSLGKICLKMKQLSS